MKTKSLSFEKDGSEYIIKEMTSYRSSMCRVVASTEEEARKLFSLNSHLVKFVGSVVWK